MTEEAVFRGYLQESLSRRFHGSRYGEALAVGVASVLCGVSHAHFGLILAHFTLFTCPMLAG